jgi:hypothetical protein
MHQALRGRGSEQSGKAPQAEYRLGECDVWTAVGSNGLATYAVRPRAQHWCRNTVQVREIAARYGFESSTTFALEHCKRFGGPGPSGVSRRTRTIRLAVIAAI